ncbi:MAG: hypothetical protein K0S53_2983 [Bacteroidetes bacterium]|jgi:hypothetical protein|nr:hypothetical protein [Bacteroidota bacterium]MDF2453430.1 hypothetical protein [Bacteroidota bacterium]
MKRIIKTCGFIFICLFTIVLNAQTYNINTGGTISTCSGTFYDAGGTGNYGNNEDYTITFCPATAGQVIQVAFTSFSTENWSATYDRLTIYDGNSTAATQIGSYAGTGSPGTVSASASNSSGCLTFRFRSDGGSVYSGWVATISCIAAPPPVINGTTGNYTLCSATFYDSGGSGSGYSNSEARTTVFCPSSAGQCIKAVFTSFNLEDNFDYLSVYDGNSTSAPMLLGSSFTAASPGSITATSVNTTGCLTFIFSSDGATTAAGWAANISCGTCGVSPETGVQQDCTGAITICSNQSVGGASLGSGNYNDLNMGLGNLGCLNNYGDTDDGSAEHQSSWYFFSPSASGTIGMTIAPATSSTDYDWAIFGPYTSLPCPPTGTPLRCSAASAANSSAGNTGLGNGAGDIEEGAGGNGWVSSINVTAGQKYILFLDNWNSTSSPFNLSWQLSNGASLGCAVLPIELLSFTGHKEKGYNLIKWTTASEINNDYFVLERSRDGINWIEITKINGSGNSVNYKHYQYEDYSFVSNEINYYRLKQVDFSGEAEYSPTISLESSEKIETYISDLHPNPTNENVYFNLFTSQPDIAYIEVIDFMGKTIIGEQQSVDAGKNHLELNMSSLKNGLYMLKISTENSGKSEIQKIIKQ